MISMRPQLSLLRALSQHLQRLQRQQSLYKSQNRDITHWHPRRAAIHSSRPDGRRCGTTGSSSGFGHVTVRLHLLILCHMVLNRYSKGSRASLGIKPVPCACLPFKMKPFISKAVQHKIRSTDCLCNYHLSASTGAHSIPLCRSHYVCSICGWRSKKTLDGSADCIYSFTNVHNDFQYHLLHIYSFLYQVLSSTTPAPHPA